MPNPDSFKVTGFPYDSRQPEGSPTSGTHHTAGHCHDLADAATQTEENNQNDSSASRRQFSNVIIPEPPKSYWGLQIRRPLVNAIRKSGTGESSGGVYAQYPYYSETPLKTHGGYSVPEGVYFTAHSFGPTIKPYYLNIRWDYDFSQFIAEHPISRNQPRYKFACTEFREDHDALPFPTCFDMLWSAHQISEQVEAHQQRAQVFLRQAFRNKTASPLAEYEYHMKFCSIPNVENATLDPFRAYEHHANFAATLEFKSPRNKLDLAIHHAKKGEEHIASEFLQAAFVQAQALWECNLDQVRALITEPQLKDIVTLWKEKRDDQVDFWRKAHNDILDATEVLLQEYLKPDVP